MSEQYRPRLSIEISDEQAHELKTLIPWGLKNQLFTVIIDDVIRLSKLHGQHFIAAILARALKLEDYSTLEVPANDHD